jgi:quercetin dioxygenase-like cupin family protein
MDVIIKNEEEIRSTILEDDSIKGVEKKVLIGTEDGSENIIMRRFIVENGGNTPCHTHDFEHVVKIESGTGIVIDEKGNEQQVSSGNSLYIPPNEKHQFKNPNSQPFQFLCIIPNPEKSG